MQKSSYNNIKASHLQEYNKKYEENMFHSEMRKQLGTFERDVQMGE